MNSETINKLFDKALNKEPFKTELEEEGIKDEIADLKESLKGGIK